MHGPPGPFTRPAWPTGPTGVGDELCCQAPRDNKFSAFLATFMADPCGHVINGDAMSRAFDLKLRGFYGTTRANIFYMHFEIDRMRPSQIRYSLSKYQGAKLSLIKLDYQTGLPDESMNDLYMNKKFKTGQSNRLEYNIKSTVPFGLITDDRRNKSKYYFEWRQKDVARLEEHEEIARLHLECAVQEAVMNENPSDFVSSKVGQALCNDKVSLAIDLSRFQHQAKMVSKLRRSLDIAMTPEAINPSGPKNQRGSRKKNSTALVSEGEIFYLTF